MLGYLIFPALWAVSYALSIPVGVYQRLRRGKAAS